MSGWVLNRGPKEGKGWFTVWGPKLSDDTWVFLTLSPCIEANILEALEIVKVEGLRSIPFSKRHQKTKAKENYMLDILERDGDRVLWRHRIFDGESWIADGRIFHTEVCDSDFMLTGAYRRKITRAVKDWLDDSGEGEKWIEENS